MHDTHPSTVIIGPALTHLHSHSNFKSHSLAMYIPSIAFYCPMWFSDYNGSSCNQ